MKRTIAIIVIVLVVIVVGALIIFRGSSSGFSSDPTACVNNGLSQGAKGHCVSDVENLLNWALYGIDEPNYKPINGQFSSSVTSEVKQFQNDNSLNKTGKLNKITWQKLCQANDPPTTWLQAARDAGCRS